MKSSLVLRENSGFRELEAAEANTGLETNAITGG
jgi:hypothetical protein